VAPQHDDKFLHANLIVLCIEEHWLPSDEAVVSIVHFMHCILHRLLATKRKEKRERNMLYIRDKDNIQELIWGNRITEQKHFLTQILKNYVCFLCDIMKRDEVTGG
jgi:hypothetical protein